MDAIRNEIATPGKALRHFNPDFETLVFSDFCKTGLGAVLGQITMQGDEVIIACTSRSLNKHEANYSSFKGEMLAAVWACRTFRVYLIGIRFTLVTDHQPLTWLFTSKNTEGAMARWACMLQSFTFTIKHRPGTQHGNADALSRFPLPSTADTSGARIDLDSDTHAAMVCTAFPYPRLQVLSVQTCNSPSVSATVNLECTPLPQQWISSACNGITLYEMCGGICAGLEALLRNGVRIQHYFYSDISVTAQIAAQHRMLTLQRTYPALLPFTALGNCFLLPQDITCVTPQHLLQTGLIDTQWLVIAGPECQDFSPAGASRGAAGSRAPIFQAVIQIIGALQQLQSAQLPLFIIENAAMQFNWKSDTIRNVDFPALCDQMGTPVTLDAARFDSYAHRLRNFWQNLVKTPDLQRAIFQVSRTPGLLVDDILDPQRFSSRVAQNDQPPFYPANKKGSDRSALPTLVSYSMSRAFRPNHPGSIWDQSVGWTEPNVAERERAMGYSVGATAAPTLTDLDRHHLLGNCMDQFALSALLKFTLQLANGVTPQHIVHPVHLVQPAPHEEVSEHLYGPTLALVLALAVPAPPDDTTPPEPQDTTDQKLSHILDTDIKLAKLATKEDAHQMDIMHDDKVLHFLVHQTLPESWPLPTVRRVIARARRYSVRMQPDGSYQVVRALTHGVTRIVPPVAARDAILKAAHHASGHFGVRRTTFLVLTTYWWYGVLKQVKAIVQACSICDRAQACFSTPTAALQSHPINGLFFSWGIDTSGPFPVIERGNTYLFHAIEYYSMVMVTIPMPNKSSASTAYAFMINVYSRFGACAQVTTDNGTEYQGHFNQMLQDLFIDHRHTYPNHPQGNGLVERSVGTVKRALRKVCEDSQSAASWDLEVPKITLAYNCSPQESTKIAPYTLLYARTPHFASKAVQSIMDRPIPAADSEAMADSLLARAAYLTQITPTVANHIQIAHHRDQLWYARTRSGAYLPRVRRFEPGDFVYLRKEVNNTLQIAAQPLILRITHILPTGSVVVQGRCSSTQTTHPSNLSPCHLPDIDATLRPDLARPLADQPCEVCNFPDDEDKMLLCDTCGDGYHLYCLQPPLLSVPTGNWICPALCICYSPGQASPYKTYHLIQLDLSAAKVRTCNCSHASHRRPPSSHMQPTTGALLSPCSVVQTTHLSQSGAP